MNLKKFFGTQQFYAGVYYIAMPILVQNVITNFVSLLDNLMVGRVGTEPMSGVAIVNQLVFVFNIALFGLSAGIGIYTAQYFGKQDNDGLRKTFKMVVVSCIGFFVIGLLVFLSFGDTLIWQYLHEGEGGIDLQATFQYGHDYLQTILWGMFPFVISQAYAGTLRCVQETRVPMVASLIAVAVNLSLNYILIYGKFGAPALGVVGAAVATNISRYVECAINVVWTHTHKIQVPFAEGMYKKLNISGDLIKRVVLTTIPMFANELLWASSQTVMNQIFSLRGIEVVSAINISSTASTLFNSFYLSMGITVSIMVGNALGTGDEELAVDTDRKLITLSFLMSVVVGILSYLFAPKITVLYNTQENVKALASSFIKVLALLVPFEAVVSASYFTIRSGGRTFITFLFDSCSAWILMVSTAFILVNYTSLSIVPIFSLVYGTIFIKMIVGLIMVKKRIWVKNIVN